MRSAETPSSLAISGVLKVLYGRRALPGWRPKVSFSSARAGNLTWPLSAAPAERPFAATGILVVPCAPAGSAVLALTSTSEPLSASRRNIFCLECAHWRSRPHSEGVHQWQRHLLVQILVLVHPPPGLPFWQGRPSLGRRLLVKSELPGGVKRYLRRLEQRRQDRNRPLCPRVWRFHPPQLRAGRRLGFCSKRRSPCSG